MTTRAAALQAFLEQFMPAYPANVPDDTELPYLTYSPSYDGWGSGEVNVPVTLWFKTASEAVPNAKADEVFNAIGMGGKLLPCNNGMLWVKRGTPWCNALNDEHDETVKRRILNLDIEYLTTD